MVMSEEKVCCGGRDDADSGNGMRLLREERKTAINRMTIAIRRRPAAIDSIRPKRERRERISFIQKRQTRPTYPVRRDLAGDCRRFVGERRTMIPSV